MDIAVVGAGIAGLSCAWRLAQARDANVTLYEARGVAGGHANAVDVTLEGRTHPVDTGFLVFNERTYPQLIALFAELGIATVKSEMTFSVHVDRGPRRPLEWAGTSLRTVFVQRRNAADPRFLRMLADVLRFNRDASALANGDADAARTWTLGEYLDAKRYSRAFRDWYLLPMAAAIWSSPTTAMRDFPLSTFVRFCANHGLLQIANRPAWFTVAGGSRGYVDRLLAALPDVRLGTPVTSVARVRLGDAQKVAVRSERPGAGHASQGTAYYDHVVLASHSDQSLAVLDGADADEREVLGAIRYQSNRAVLHTDASLLPTDFRAWAAWNYRSEAAATGDRPVSVHYLINKLQPLPFERPVIVSLNAALLPRASTVIAEFDYAHPLFDARAIRAQARLPALQGRGGVWYAGAWTGYGFHEDGLRSGLAVAAAIEASTAESTNLPVPLDRDGRLAA